MTKEELIQKIASLPDFIFKKLTTVVETYDKEKETAETVTYEICPKCGKVHPVIIKAGKSRSGKQLYRCKTCNFRFVEDVGAMTYRSHLSREQWNELMKLTMDGTSLKETAESLGICKQTAFDARHKFLHALEKDETSIVVSEMVELDEKYLRKSHKGLQIGGVKGHKRGERANKRGLSDEKICMLTAVARGGNSFLRSFNMAKPSTKEIMNLLPHIEENTFLWTDGLKSYATLAEKLGSTRVELLDITKYDKVNHLNTVNSFHSLIEAWYNSMRGVASKYINRYAALFNMRWLTKDMGSSEALLHIRARLSNVAGYIKLDEIKTIELFAPPNLAWSA